MCWCDPEIRTPECGKATCRPPQTPHHRPEAPKPSHKIEPDYISLNAPSTDRALIITALYHKANADRNAANLIRQTSGLDSHGDLKRLHDTLIAQALRADHLASELEE